MPCLTLDMAFIGFMSIKMKMQYGYGYGYYKLESLRHMLAKWNFTNTALSQQKRAR